MFPTDEDGDVDIVVPVFTASAGGNLYWFKSNGAANPAFTQQTVSTAVIPSPNQAVCGDFDGDGFNDLGLTTHSGGTVNWYRSSGGASATFTSTTLVPSGTIMYGLDAADL